jgi:anti-anti-sigma factor
VPALESRRRKDAFHIKLPGDLDNALPAALREVVLRETRAGTTMRIDCAAVDKVSTPSVQLLLAAADYIGRQEARFVLANPSEALVEAFSDLGLFATLMTWNVE